MIDGLPSVEISADTDSADWEAFKLPDGRGSHQGLLPSLHQPSVSGKLWTNFWLSQLVWGEGAIATASTVWLNIP